MAMNQTENRNLIQNTYEDKTISKFNPAILKDIISKKTNRGRKSKNEMPQKLKCDICLEFEEFSRTSLIKCTKCQAKIHSQCYKEKIKDEDTFTCERCQLALKDNIPIESYHCLICNRCDGILYKQDTTNAFYHETCLKFIPELYQENEQGDLSTRWRYKNSCKYCREKLTSKKSVIKCANPRCKCYYHIPCAIQKGMIFSINFQSNYFGLSSQRKESIPFFCAGHNKKISAAYRDCIKHTDSLDSRTDTSSRRCYENDNDNDYQILDKEQHEEEDKEITCSSVLNLDFSSMINEAKENYLNEFDSFVTLTSMFIDNNYSDINMFESLMCQDSQLYFESI